MGRALIVDTHITLPTADERSGAVFVVKGAKRYHKICVA